MVQVSEAAAESLRPTMRLVSWNRAKHTAHANGSSAAQAMAPAPGRTMIRMPANPARTPSQSWHGQRHHDQGRGEGERGHLGQRQKGQPRHDGEARQHRQEAADELQPGRCHPQQRGPGGGARHRGDDRQGEGVACPDDLTQWLAYRQELAHRVHEREQADARHHQPDAGRPVRAPRRGRGQQRGPATTPSSCRREIAAPLRPTISARISSVCSPSTGARRGGSRGSALKSSGRPGTR